MADVLIYGDTERSPAMRHEVPLGIGDPFLYLETDGRRAVVTNAHGQPVACSVSHHIDYDRNRVGLRVPRSCLGKASWVRVGVRTTIAGTTSAYVDDARVAGYSATLHYGRRVHR